MEEVTAQEPLPQLVRGVVLRIQQPSCSAAFLRIANNCFPLQPHASHLKRIRKVRRSETVPHHDEGSGAQIDDAFPHAEGQHAQQRVEDHLLELLLGIEHTVNSNLLKEFEGASGSATSVTTHTVWVPDRAPRTSPAEWQKWCAIWPFSVPKPRLPSLLPQDEATRIRRIFGDIVMPLTMRACNSETRGIGAVLVDPNRDWHVLSASDEVDACGGRNTAACLGHTPVPGSTEADGIVLEHPVIHVLKKLAHMQKHERSAYEEDGDDVPYLANNMDLLVSHEPCVMCSMALVHSRVGRVFYCFPNSTRGGLGSRFQIHTIPSLNHHFRVFRCSTSWLGEEARELECA